MTFERVSVRRFQSIWDADVELGGLTVIVGPSNSGKSAFGRALRAVARNTTGSGHVSQGASTASISVSFDGQAVVLERGKGASTYRLIHSGLEDVYAKAGTSVPDEVATALALPEGDPDAHFTTQFDGPFLLTSTPSVASRVLGELTNVTLLSEAAREANRRRGECTKEVTFLKAEVERSLAVLQERYAGLPVRKKAAESAREMVDVAQDAYSRVVRLERLSSEAVTASIAAGKVRDEAQAMSRALDAVVQGLDAAEDRARRYSEITTLLDRFKKAAMLGRTARLEATFQQGRVDEQEAELMSALEQAGVCPVCGAAV